MDRKLELIQSLVRSGKWQASDHVLGYIADGEYSEADIEMCIATGAIVKTQRDETGTSVDGNKYAIRGADCCGLAFETVGKIIEMVDGQTYFVITAYEPRQS